MRHVPGVRATVAAAIASLTAMTLPLVATAQRGPRRPVAPPVVAKPTPAADPATLAGWPLYDRFCLACHGVRGDGNGPAAPWLDPLPRDFTAGWFKWGGTADAHAPARSALADTIRWGAPGTAMHAFGASLGDAQIDQLVEVVRAFAKWSPDAFEPIAREPFVTKVFDDAGKRAQVARGRELFGKLGCPACHGDGAKGDGPSSRTLKDAGGNVRPPYDLTAFPVRRPRAPDGSAEQAALDSIVNGVGGTPMPGFNGAAPLDDLMAVAAYVVSIGPARVEAIGDLTAANIDRDKTVMRSAAGYRWGATDDADGALFGGEIHLQGEPPAVLGPVQASLSSRQCGRCHAKQLREWTGTIHASAASPGLMAQVRRFDKPSEVTSCLRCHSPLAEQQLNSDIFDSDLQSEGLTCAACHVRDNVRHGPHDRAPSLLPLPGYPLRELAVYERADFCVGCHQLPGRLAVAGRPLLDTYREWLLGPYMKRGIQCQHCHMPNREHTWKGVHDAETFRQGIAVAATATRRADGILSVHARVGNVGAGHYLPTTPTPAAWVSIELLDSAGSPIPGTRAEKRIGRHLRFVDKHFEEIEDTRIPPGGHLDLDRAWRGGRLSSATHLHIVVRVRPDDYYEGLYKSRLRAKLDPETRATFQSALARAESSGYIAYDALLPVRGHAPGSH
jgi:mono/diheme cytochrome c family protein